MGVHPAYQPLVGQQTKQQAGRGVAGVAHFSALLTSIFGPLLIFALSPQGSYPRKEAAKAFNFQLVALVSWIGLLVVQGVTGLGIFNFLIGLAFIGWVVLTVLERGQGPAGRRLDEPGQEGRQGRGAVGEVGRAEPTRRRGQPGSKPGARVAVTGYSGLAQLNRG